ncbi:MAG: hypothetical protein SGJ20_03835 [Planctomycetota bacterium]|nr:hypothetical protein [Planctomycetota bacterium]
MTKINWAEHVAAFRASTLTAAAYCAGNSLKLENFRYHLDKDSPKRRGRKKPFVAFHVATELVIVRDKRGGLSLSGFDVKLCGRRSKHSSRTLSLQTRNPQPFDVASELHAFNVRLVSISRLRFGIPGAWGIFILNIGMLKSFHCENKVFTLFSKV